MKPVHARCLFLALISFALPACQKHEERAESEHHTIVVTSPMAKDVVMTQQYVCQIHSQRHIKVCALESGYLEAIPVKEGQAVKTGDVLFRVLPTLYKAKLDAELAEAQLAQIELNNTRRLREQKVVSDQEVALYEAKLAKAQAKAKLAEAELKFTEVKAPFDGIVDRLHEQQGSLVKEGDMLTTLSDNSVMWVYFNVPEARYLEYMASQDRGEDDVKVVEMDKKKKTGDDDDEYEQSDDDDDDKDAKKVVEKGKPAITVAVGKDDRQIELVLANGSKYPHNGKIGAIEARFNNETGNIPFRADFPNPKRLLRHGQTGTVLIHRKLANAIVIPQRATFEVLDKRYVYVVDDAGVVNQREIAVQHEMDDIFVVQTGLNVNDKIVLEGVRQVRNGQKLEYEFRKPEEVFANQKHHAE